MPCSETPSRSHIPQAFEDEHFSIQSVLQLVRENYEGLTASQACEDSFNHQKNAKVIKGKKKYRRVEKTMAAVLAKKVLSSIHRFKDVPTDMHLEQQSDRLPKDAFYADPLQASFPLHKICSGQSTPDFHSPSAALWCQRDADLVVVRKARLENAWPKMDMLWLGQLCRGSHKLLLLRPDGQWFFPKYVWPDSAIVAVKATKSKLPGTDIDYWEPSSTCAEEYIVVWDLTFWKAVSYRWRSPSWQAAQAVAVCAMKPAVRAFCASENAQEAPLLKVCAREAFFDLKRSYLAQLAAELEVAIPDAAYDFELLSALVASILGLGEAATLKVLQKRLAGLEKKELWIEELEQLDEAVELLDQHDKAKAVQARDDARQAKVALLTFQESFSAKARALKTAADAALKKKQKPTKRIRLPHFPEHDIDIAQARLYLPPAATMWVGKADGNWQGYLPPYPRISRSFKKYGEAPALVLVLQYLWRRHAEISGLLLSELPVDGLFEAVSVGAASGSSASGSAGGP